MMHKIPCSLLEENDQFGWRLTAKQKILLRLGTEEFEFLGGELLRDFHALVGRAADAYEAGFGSCEWCKATCVPVTRLNVKVNDEGDTDGQTVCLSCADLPLEAFFAEEDAA